MCGITAKTGLHCKCKGEELHMGFTALWDDYNWHGKTTLCMSSALLVAIPHTLTHTAIMHTTTGVTANNNHDNHCNHYGYYD